MKIYIILISLLFVGTKEEFNDMKLEVKNLEFYECKNFLEMASIIKSESFKAFSSVVK